MDDPSRYADSIRTAYQTYLQGRGGTAARSVATRLRPDSTGESALAGMRGPYLQALPIANWSETDWKTFARSESLHPNVTRAFHKEGFRRLYDFQERSVSTILNGDDTVITAATGRGKTEAWLIPILDQIVKSKSGNSSDRRTSTKALLLYPTKALAQDQFKRLVQILYRINRNLRQKEWVTIGIYDGDTPRNIYESKAQGYLNRTFQHFGCPGANDEIEKCRNCGQGVFVERTTDDYRLRPDKPYCEDDEDHRVPLDFVRLTKHSILNSGADIVLTNPDTLNYRLLNINAETEQKTFVYDPSFLIFDEVHTYDSLLGSYTATLVKRLRRIRQQFDCDELQVVGSSATVENDAELFRQISGATEISQVSERPRTLPDTPPANVPAVLQESVVNEEALSDAGTEGATPAQVGSIDLTVPNADDLDNDRLKERVSDDLYDRYTNPDTEDPVASTFQALHTDLSDDPRSPAAFISDCAERFDLAHEEAERLVENFQRAGRFAGLLESRHHLFSWPLDGFYACASCRAVYRSPQDRCTECDGDFVTRATYCTQCDEEHLVANACSRCDRLVPYVHTDEGLLGEDEHEVCPHCHSTVGDSVPMHRVTFCPWHECVECGNREQRSVTADCPNCTAPGVPANDRGSFVCRNPDCEHTWSASWQCSICGGESASLATIESPVACPTCETVHASEELPMTCDCGTRVSNTRLVPWVCADKSCHAAQFTMDPPNQCSCGETTFAKGGLYDIAVKIECRSCNSMVVPGGSCGCEESDYQTVEQPYRRYRTYDGQRAVVSPLEHRRAIPCDHSLYSTVVGDAFDELLRGPTNVAVTTSQYLLRELVDDQGFDAAKLLAFSDSHRDMKELDRAFTDPEVETLLDQLVLASIDIASAGLDSKSLSRKTVRQLKYDRERLAGVDVGPDDREWTNLSDVTETGYTLLSRIEAEVVGDDVRDAEGVDFEAVVLGRGHINNREYAVKEKLRRQAIRHVGERRGPDHPSLEHDGLIDVRIAPKVESELDEAEETIVRALASSGNNAEFASITEEDRQSDAAANRLIQQGVLTRKGRDDDRIAFTPGVLELAHAGVGDVSYDPFKDDYYSTLAGFGAKRNDTVACPDGLAERMDIDHPRFSERAFTATRSRVAILSSRLYYGSTPKMERRHIEHQFRDGAVPNFLSSGPTMELGVDIGTLDALLMYGTPPNMNAYLQRVGRAGRSSHSSLVHSVSQRNPIDYYYYDEPTELITADEQPVPLNEHNDRVLGISLAWAVLDYVAANFVVPWDVSQHDVTGGENFHRKSESTPDQREDAGKYTHLLARSVSQLELDEESSRLRPLGVLLDDNEAEIRRYLESILDYAYCPDCHRHYDREREGESCSEDNCAGRLIDAQAEHDEAIFGALDVVRDVFVDGYRQHVGRIRDRIEGIESHRDELRANRATTGDKERDQLDRAIAQTDARIDVLETYLGELSNEEYGDILSDAYAEYAFNLRSVSDTVDIDVVDETGDPKRIGDDRGGRSSRLAIGELHPAAAYLHDRRPHVVSQVFTDDKATTDLRECVESHATDDSVKHLSNERVCQSCGKTTTNPEDECDCSENAWQDRQLFAMESVEATLDTVRLPNSRDTAGMVYERPSERVQNTFSRRQTAILNFDATERFELTTPDGGHIGTVTLGAYDILEFTQSFRAKYQSGGMDDEEMKFELCDEPDCPGIVYEDSDDTRRCSVNPDHVPDTGNEAIYARFGYQYETTGVRLSLTKHDIEATHALAHGLRLALQKLSGVQIRDVSEHVATDHVDVFDAQEGGAAVTRQLVQEREIGFRNFDIAMDMLMTQFDCDCTEGCPRCVYQYGCAKRNQPRSLKPDPVRELVRERGLNLHRVKQAVE